MFIGVLMDCIFGSPIPNVKLDQEVAVGWVLVAGFNRHANIFCFRWMIAVCCALGSRLMLDMRERYFKEQTALSLNGNAQVNTEMHPPARRMHQMSFATASLHPDVSALSTTSE
jgi:hypothetical protein